MTAAGGSELTPVKRALLEIRNLKDRLAAAEGAAREPVALVGAGLRLPGGIDDLDRLWAFLAEGGNAVTAIPADRWDVPGHLADDPDAPGRMTTRHGAFLDDVYRFDAEFFGIAPVEAESMDPQQRIVLETAWRAFEDAGIAPSALAGSRTGVFLGVSNNDFGRMIYAHPRRITPYFGSGNAASVLAGRVSYVLGLGGPSLSVDTACSSSLTAVHLAVQSLRAGECDLALAGGINLILSPEINITFSKAGMLAPDGRCKTFDAAADGYVRGEGCAIVVLKRLRDCEPEDRVLAIIRGTAVNQDGRSGGLTAPNGPAQEAVIRAALAAANVHAADIGYVEAHGTGTPLGDPIEVHALGASFRGRPSDRPLLIGSIKSNLGHLEAAAGIVGLLKVTLALQRGEIPPHLHLRTRNPHIDWQSMPIEVPTVRTPFPEAGGRRLGGVSSFGFSGTNAHVVLESAAPRAAIAGPLERPCHVLAVSARTAEGLTALATAYAGALEHGSATLQDACFTAGTGRAHLAHRLTVRGRSVADVCAGLRAEEGSAAAGAVVRGLARKAPRVAFLFTGGGAQTPGMARGLYEHSAVFREAFDRAAAILEPMLGRSLREVIDTPGDADAPVHENRFGQPALVAVEMALTSLWRSWGIAPTAVVGHSLGEYAAAHAAGIVSMEDALRMVVARTRLVDRLGNSGAMATVFAAPGDVERALAAEGGGAVIAAVNGPEQVVVSGVRDAVERVAATFERRGVRVARLRVSYASHSPLMDPILDAFEGALSDVSFADPRITFVSNLTGAAAGHDVIGRPSYWREHLRQPVRFAESMRTLATMGMTHFVEIGPHPVLVSMGAACLPQTGVWLASLSREHDDWETILETLQTLHCDGAEVDWAGFDRGHLRRRVSLPGYPFGGRSFGEEWATMSRSASGERPDDWPLVTQAMERQAERGPLGVDLSGYAGKWSVLERLTVAHALTVFREAGLFAAPGDRACLLDVRDRLGAHDRYRHLLGRWLARFVASGDLRQDADVFVSDRPLPDADLTGAWVEAETALAGNQPLLAYVRHCGRLLGGVLRGHDSPLETLFPGGEFDLADGLYRRSSTMQYVNALAAEAVASFAAGRPSGTLRVLEVGAGTGGTTVALLPHLPADRTQYRFTDVSEVFLDRAREQLRAFPFIEFGAFNLDEELGPQGLVPSQYDLVIGSNAVHACRNLRVVLARLRSLVAPGGLLLLIESTTHLAWFDMTTGLVEGWQHFEDDLRADNPLLDSARWITALREAGFEEARAWPGDSSAGAEIGQHVILARAGGRAAVAADQDTSASGASADTPAPSPAAADMRSARQDVLEALPSERLDRLRAFVGERVARVLKLDPASSPAGDDRLMDLGLDSLMAVRLRNLLGTGLGLDRPLPVSLMFDHPTVDAIAAYLLERLVPSDRVAPVAAGAPAAGVLGEAAVAAMTDSEVEALLLARLEPK